MARIQCPHCGGTLRTAVGSRKVLCPLCQTKFRREIPLAPPKRFRFPFKLKVEFASALIGLALLGLLVLLQSQLLLPWGKAHPYERQVYFPPIQIDGVVVAADSHQMRPYNEILFWGSVGSYLLTAVAAWYWIRRWKGRVLRQSVRHGFRPISGLRKSMWRKWGGGTAAIVILVGGVIVAMRGKELLWFF